MIRLVEPFFKFFHQTYLYDDAGYFIICFTEFHALIFCTKIDCFLEMRYVLLQYSFHFGDGYLKFCCAYALDDGI
jgi:hypothetical protein